MKHKIMLFSFTLLLIGATQLHGRRLIVSNNSGDAIYVYVDGARQDFLLIARGHDCKTRAKAMDDGAVHTFFVKENTVLHWCNKTNLKPEESNWYETQTTYSGMKYVIIHDKGKFDAYSRIALPAQPDVRHKIATKEPANMTIFVSAKDRGADWLKQIPGGTYEK